MNYKKNICRRFFDSQVTGKGYKASYEITASYFNDDEDNVVSELRQHVHKLLELYALPKSSYKQIHESVKAIWLLLKDHDEPTSELLYQVLCEHGIVELLSDILLEDIFGINGYSKQPPSATCPENRMDDAQYLLSIMNRVMMETHANYHHLRWNNRLIEALLSFLTTTNYLRHVASSILELALLGTEQPPIYLSQLGGMRSYLEKIVVTQRWTPFFHLLSMFMSDAEYIASSSTTLEKHDHWLALRSTQAVDANHRFLLDIPNFLEGMCGAIQSNYSPPPVPQPPPPSGLNDVHDLFDILQYLATQPQIVFENENPGSVFFFFKQHRTYAVCINSCPKVQQRLADCNFFASLISPVENIVWDKSPLVDVMDPDHDGCTTDTLIQIQFLRLVHAIADNHANRYYLLTSSEIAELVQSAREKNYNLPPLLEQFDASKAPKGKLGVLSLIVNKLHTEDDKSVIRFWITRAMEAFLRGETSAAHQFFLINKNVIENTVGVVLFCGPKHEMVLQGSFDFLSTIMRNNPEAFRRFEAAIDCTAKFRQFVKEVEEHLIDSNMFLRCVILTNYNKRSIDFCPSRLLDWYASSDILLKLVAKLIRLLSVPTLSQENVSCLNTTILVLYLADQDGFLPSYLRSLSDLQDGQFIIGNLKNLLQFWRSHYTLPTKKMDRLNLELSTGIGFSLWCRFVDLLLNTEQTCTSSLRHYLKDKKVASPFLFRRSRIP